MKRYVQYDSFNIYSFAVDSWPHPVHNHTYCEIIFIRGGAGSHIINGNRFGYQAGDVFLLGPEDYHYFEIGEHTRFCYIRFSENFIEEPLSSRGKNWRAMLGALLRTPYQANGSVVKCELEKKQLDLLLQALLYEWEKRQPGGAFEIMMDSMLKVILSIIARNLLQERSMPETTAKSQSLEALMLYIRQHIHQPEKLKIEVIAESFNYSKNYLSPYFKRQTGQSLQQYILRYKLTLIENRLLHSELSLSEIAAEFGFTDISHFHKIFRKYYGIAPKDFRNRGVAA